MACQHWFFDARLKAFNPDEHTDGHTPHAVLNFQTEIVEYRELVLGGRDGYLRYYDPAFHDDDGTAMESFVMFQPVTLQRGHYLDGRLLELIGEIAALSGDVDWEIRVAPSHEEAVNETAFKSGTWTGTGRRHTIRPRARGASLALKLLNGQDLSWAIEAIKAIAIGAGRTRIG